MRTLTTQLDWREGRRRRAWELKQPGWKQQDSAAALGVTPGAVSPWRKRGREQGVEGLRHHPAPGRQPRLTPEQLAQIPALVAAGAEASGFGGQIWTCPRVAAGIRRTVGVSSHPAQVSRRLHAVRHRVQRPRARATQRDETAIQAWGQERWPALASVGKTAAAQGRTSVWGDHSGGSLLPRAVRTWAPCGQTPVLSVPLTPEHLCASGGITPQGRRFRPTPEQADHSEDVVRFLRVLVRQIRGTLL